MDIELAPRLVTKSMTLGILPVWDMVMRSIKERGEDGCGLRRKEWWNDDDGLIEDCL